MAGDFLGSYSCHDPDGEGASYLLGERHYYERFRHEEDIELTAIIGGYRMGTAHRKIGDFLRDVEQGQNVGVGFNGLTGCVKLRVYEEASELLKAREKQKLEREETIVRLNAEADARHQEAMQQYYEAVQKQ